MGEEKQDGGGGGQGQTTAHVPNVGSQPKGWTKLGCLWIETRRWFDGGMRGTAAN